MFLTLQILQLSSKDIFFQVFPDVHISDRNGRSGSGRGLAS